jgi:hypothetical protein
VSAEEHLSVPQFSGLGYDPHVREVLPLHMMSHHGWTAGDVKDALEWPERANVLPGHHDAAHATAYAEHIPVPHAHRDVSHSLYSEHEPDPLSEQDRRWLGTQRINPDRELGE